MDHTVLLIYDNKPYIRTIENGKTIREIFASLDENIILNENYFYIMDGILVSENTIVSEQKQCHNIICNCKLRGGGILDDILDGILAVFNPIVNPIVMIGNIFVFCILVFVWMLKMLGWLVIFVIWLLTDLLNPINFLRDFFNGVMIILIAIFSSIFNLLTSMAALSISTIGGWMQGFWGWDQSSLTKNDMQSNYFRSFNRTKGKKCYLTNSNTVPFSVLLGTIVCPPMGVFMDMGLTGWLNILICVLLTLAFYIPGLVYALLIIYS